jgi:hypothetical protein
MAYVQKTLPFTHEDVLSIQPLESVIDLHYRQSRRQNIDLITLEHSLSIQTAAPKDKKQLSEFRE